MKAISLKDLHLLARSMSYTDFDNEVQKRLKGFSECVEKQEIFLIDSDEAIKALTFCYTKFPTGKNLGEIIKEYLNLNK